MDKVAVITGGASGIGRAVVEHVAGENLTAVILDINDEDGRRAAAEIEKQGKRARFLRVDVTQENEVQEGFRKILLANGRVDVLVNVAGGSLHRHKVEEFPLAHWQAVIDANLTSTFLCCKAVIGAMKAQGSGVIINISSDIAFSGSENRSAYSAAKAGILGFSKTLALELAPFAVRVNVVAPGRVATKRVRGAYSAQEWESSNKRIPLGRPGEPEDIAEAVAFLASEASRHITGQTIHVNGGRIMR